MHRSPFSLVKSFVLTVFRGIMQHNTGGRASAISFFIFSAMIPILILMIYGASLLVPEDAVERVVDELLQSYVPHLPTEGTLVPQTIHRLISVRSDLRIISIIGFLWTAVGGFVLLQSLVDEIWGIHKRRSFWRQYLVGFIMLGILLALTIGASIVSVVTPLLGFLDIGSSIGAWLGLANVVVTLALPVILFLTVFFIYRVLPSHRPKLVPTLIGSMFATLAIYVCRGLFVVYTHYLGNYQMVYGALTFIMLLTFWIYISSIVLLLGVEVSAAIERIQTS